MFCLIQPTSATTHVINCLKKVCKSFYQILTDAHIICMILDTRQTLSLVALYLTSDSCEEAVCRLWRKWANTANPETLVSEITSATSDITL